MLLDGEPPKTTDGAATGRSVGCRFEPCRAYPERPIALGDAWIGERWAVGSAVLEVCQPREPCFKLGIRMGTAAFVDDFAGAGRPGAYLRIVGAGSVAVGDTIEVVGRPAVRLTIGELAGAARHADRGLIERVATHPAVAEGWRQAARRAVARADRA